MAEEATKSAAGAAAAVARGAVDVCLSGGAFGGFSFSLKIDSPWLAAGIAIGTFYIANKALSEIAIRKALQHQTSSTANADPEVTSISTGSILVQVQCHTEESFLRFADDIGLRSFRYKVVSIQVVSIQIKVVSIQIKSRFDTNQKSFRYNLHLPKL